MPHLTRRVTVGGRGSPRVDAVALGGGLPVAIQTMWKDRLSFADLETSPGPARAGGPSPERSPAERIVSRIEGLRKMGCALLRFAVPDLESAEILGNLASMVSMPLVADIHFDYKIALRCLDFPIAKIRINPGNIGVKERVEAVLSKAAERSVPIRIGVNGGSLPLELRRRVDEGSLESAEALALAAERELAIFDEYGFRDVLVSMKASSVADTIKANRLFAERSDAPLHVGVTEAGPLIAGVVRNTAALMVLLGEGIGDTIRVSLSDTVEKEVIAGREILGLLSETVAGADAAANADAAGGSGGRSGVRIISCPRCGRAGFDTHGFTERWQARFYAMDKNISVAVMGCEVNGPEEGRHADIGITGAGNKVLIFRKGKVIRIVDKAEADAAFEEELNKL